MSKQIIAGGVAIGGGAPVTIQSMCNTHTEDAKATIAQIHALEEAGCEIVRVTVPNMEAAHALSEIKENISIPLVADIHFDYRLAVEAAARGPSKDVRPLALRGPHGARPGAPTAGETRRASRWRCAAAMSVIRSGSSVWRT